MRRLPAGPVRDVGQPVEAVEGVIDIPVAGINDVGDVPVGVIPVLDEVAIGVLVAGHSVVGVEGPGVGLAVLETFVRLLLASKL